MKRSTVICKVSKWKNNDIKCSQTRKSEFRVQKSIQSKMRKYENKKHHNKQFISDTQLSTQTKQQTRLNWGISDKIRSIPGTWRAKLTRTESASSESPASRDSKRKGRLWGRTISSEPLGMRSEARSPRPVWASGEGAMFRAWWTNPPSLRTHLMRSGGWATSLEEKEGEREGMEAEDNGRKWVSDREAIAILEAAIVALNNAYSVHFVSSIFWDFSFMKKFNFSDSSQLGYLL